MSAASTAITPAKNCLSLMGSISVLGETVVRGGVATGGEEIGNGVDNEPAGGAGAIAGEGTCVSAGVGDGCWSSSSI